GWGGRWYPCPHRYPHRSSTSGRNETRGVVTSTASLFLRTFAPFYDSGHKRYFSEIRPERPGNGAGGSLGGQKPENSSERADWVGRCDGGCGLLSVAGTPSRFCAPHTRGGSLFLE